jgi:SAM-dependent methyltransferase
VFLACLMVVYLRVPPVPSRRQELEIAFELADIKPNELVVDLGAGDGRVLQVARNRYGARIMGWEISPPVWLLAKLRLGLGSDVWLANLWKADVSDADVVFVFLMAELMGRVESEIWAKMKPGARMISNAFKMPNVAPAEMRDGVYLYVK